MNLDAEHGWMKGCSVEEDAIDPVAWELVEATILELLEMGINAVSDNLSTLPVEITEVA